MSPVQFASHLAHHRQRLQAFLPDRFGVVLQPETGVQPFCSSQFAVIDETGMAGPCKVQFHSCLYVIEKIEN